MTRLRSAIAVIFTLFFCSGLAQDIILRKDGGVIPCKIVFVDSSFIVYKRPSANYEENIMRSDVERFIIRSASNQNDDSFPINAKKDLLYFTPRFGRGFPTAEFGKQDLNDLNAGLALPGNIFQLFVTYKPDPWIGLSVGYRYQEFQFNKSLLQAELERVNPGIVFSTDVAPWKVKGFHASLDLSIPIVRDREWTLDLFAMAGLPHYSYPSFNIRASLGGVSLNLTERAEPVQEPAITFGGKLCLRPNNNIILHLQADYFSGNATFQTKFSSPGVISANTYSQRFSAVTISIGLSVVIQKS